MSVPATQAAQTAPDFLHELFWGQIASLLGDELQRYQPRFGTVAGVSGANLLVLPDGAATPRTMPHVAGRRYVTGDRVVFGPVQGKPVVYGGVLTGTGAAEAVIGTLDILPGAIGTNQIGNGAVTTTKLGSDVDGRITTAQNAANSAQSTANTAITKADNAKDKADAAQTTANSAANAASAAQSSATAADAHAQNVYNLLNQGASDGTQAITRIQQNLNQRIDAACLKACGCKTCNCGTCASGVGT